MNSEITRLKKLMQKHEASIKAIQNSCPHSPDVLWYWNFSNTGNYDKSDDCYWATYHCQECGKIWNDDQGKFKGVNKTYG